MSILVTGASGFIGSHLSECDKISRIVIREGDYSDTWKCDLYCIDNLDGQTIWDNAFEGINSIIHLAGLAHSKSFTKENYQSVNVDGAAHLALQAANAGVKRFVFVSSIGVNGCNTHGKPFSPLDTTHADNDYTHSKCEAEQKLKKISEENGIELVIVRPTLVYGRCAPGNFGSLISLISKFPILPFALANNRRSFVAAQNLADLLVTCANHPNAGGHTFLASDSETVSIKEFTNAIGQGLGKDVIQIPVPVRLMRFLGKVSGKSAMIEQLYGDLQVDSSNLKDVLNWTPPLTMKQAMASLRNPGA
ncbi:NAD-dependent epimerase/dehydratase family protein [Vibrio splendidus]|uniref:NAD-dependent epimerase/dehydratase family protein n=1 Tax=Vibrio splendidus TaxID=29497 RepID=UPI000769D3D7|nr:NAD-dependent epimerase/dehydratase family protein [Vibrio splendidus]